MKSPLALTFAALLLLPSASAADSDVCMEFLEQHPQDDKWQQACLEWLEQWAPPAPPTSASPESASDSATILQLDAPRHVGATDLELAELNQNEVSIAIDPSSGGGGRAFVISKTDPFQNGLFASYSSNPTDPGTPWNPAKIAVGPGGAIPAALGDPWAVFSDQGKLFIAYLHDPGIDDSAAFGIPFGARPTVVAKSNDGGATFTFVEAIESALPSRLTDRPTMTTGSGGSVAAGSLWVIYREQDEAGRVIVRGAALDANGEPIEDFCGVGTGDFCYIQVIAEDDAVAGPAFPGHLAVGPDGEVLATYLRNANFSLGPTDVFTALDPDGLGPQGFPPATPPSASPVLTTNVGFRESVPPHAVRRISPTGEPRVGPQQRADLPGLDHGGAPRQR